MICRRNWSRLRQNQGGKLEIGCRGGRKAVSEGFWRSIDGGGVGGSL